MNYQITINEISKVIEMVRSKKFEDEQVYIDILNSQLNFAYICSHLYQNKSDFDQQFKQWCQNPNCYYIFGLNKRILKPNEVKKYLNKLKNIN